MLCCKDIKDLNHHDIRFPTYMSLTTSQLLKCVISFGSGDDITVKHVTCKHVKNHDIIQVVENSLTQMRNKCDFQSVCKTLLDALKTPLQQENKLREILPLHLNINSKKFMQDEKYFVCAGNACVSICSGPFTNKEKVFGNQSYPAILQTELPCLHIKHTQNDWTSTLTAVLCTSNLPNNHCIQHFVANNDRMFNIDQLRCPLKKQKVEQYCVHDDKRNFSHFKRRQFLLQRHNSAFRDLSFKINVAETSHITTPLFLQLSNVVPLKTATQDHSMLITLIF